MNKNQRINTFLALREELNRFISHPDDSLLPGVVKENPWFIRNFVIHALQGIIAMLNEDAMHEWLKNYKLEGNHRKSVGIVMPGNIPLAGFHDLMCVLLSGNKAIIKPSHADKLLIDYIANVLTGIHGEYGEMIDPGGDFQSADAIIATGSDNTARYFRYTFREKPVIIRQNRSSCAILNGHENDEDLRKLADDVFLYFGLGCRNVSKIFIPKDHDIRKLRQYFSGYEWIKSHHKYFNNYIYQKAITRVSGIPSTDMDFFHFERNSQFVSPVSVIYYEAYDSEVMLHSRMARDTGKIQCIVSGTPNPNHVNFGEAQLPGPSDFADGIDTLAFLEKLDRQ